MAKVYLFSVEHSVLQGAWVEDGYLVYRHDPDVPVEDVMLLSGIPLKGAHNVENVLAALCAARLAGASAEAIRKAVESFQAVEHRLEFVARSMASSSTTTPKPPTWMRRPRPLPHSLPAFI